MDSGKDYGRLIQRDASGTYCIMFLNRYALDSEEIKSIFSQFGEIYSIKAAGNERGYRFIRYKNFEEAEYAIEGVKDHPKIKLCEHNSKKNKNGQNGYANNQKDGRSNRDTETENYRNYERNISQEQFQDNSNLKRDLFDKAFISNNLDDHQKHNDFDQGDFYEKTKHTSNHQESSSESSKTNKEGSINDLPDLVSSKRSSIKSNGSTSAIEEVKVNIPDLVTRRGKLLSDNIIPKSMIFTAKEVIVGNIHPDFGAPYILHLFDKFQPIAISNIFVQPNSHVRYCYVYFKTTEESMSVEAYFDRKSLSGKQLIVLRPNRLVEEALA